MTTNGEQHSDIIGSWYNKKQNATKKNDDVPSKRRQNEKKKDCEEQPNYAGSDGNFHYACIKIKKFGCNFVFSDQRGIYRGQIEVEKNHNIFCVAYKEINING